MCKLYTRLCNGSLTCVSKPKDELIRSKHIADSKMKLDRHLKRFLSLNTERVKISKVNGSVTSKQIRCEK
jgi:hypothetical protein